MTPGTALARSRAGVIGVCTATALGAALVAVRSPPFSPSAAVVALGAAGVCVIVAFAWLLTVRRMSQRSRTVETQELDALRHVVELAGVGEWRWDLRSNRVVYSRACATMLGYSPTEIDSTLSAWGKLAHPDDIARVRRAVDDLCEGRVAHYEQRVRLRAADGSWQTIIDCGRITARDASGKAILAVGVHIDLSRFVGPGVPIEAVSAAPADPDAPTRGAFVVVDDDPSVRVVVEVAGRRAGMRMQTFPDAEAAWAAIVQGGPPMAIITDFDMPKTTGIELAERVRAAGLECPVLLMTGHPVEQFAGCDAVRGVLSKPFSLGELSAWLTVLAMAAGQRSRRE
ncbi:MAG TPA: PAS domain-containing protein [Nannocystaceae bacterium]|nr:PAS domain-containing protein [Nannocystaceae bacterium]